MNSTVKLAGSLVIIVACGVWLSLWFASQPAPGETVQHMQPLACAACGKAWGGMAGDSPVKCHFCGEKQAWNAYKCDDCQAIFPSMRNKGALTDQEDIRCTKCKSVNFLRVEGDEVEIIP